MVGKYTSGPWRYYTTPQPNGCPIIGNDRGLMVAMLAHSVNHDDRREEAIANARLIAAAPELLETLQACRAQWIHSANAERCLAAIAKATE